MKICISPIHALCTFIFSSVFFYRYGSDTVWLLKFRWLLQNKIKVWYLLNRHNKPLWQTSLINLYKICGHLLICLVTNYCLTSRFLQKGLQWLLAGSSLFLFIMHRKKILINRYDFLAILRGQSWVMSLFFFFSFFLKDTIINV